MLRNSISFDCIQTESTNRSKNNENSVEKYFTHNWWRRLDKLEVLITYYQIYSNP